MNDSKKKIKEMALIFANTKELNFLINQKLSQEKVELLKYYLMPKEWLDDYKTKNDYKNIVSHINFYMMKDYPSFKALLENENSFNLNYKNINFNLDQGPITQPEQNASLLISNSLYQNILCPKNFVPIKEEIINEYMSFNFDFSNKDIFLYNLLVGEGNIFLFDKGNKLNVFICIKDTKQDCYSPIYLLSYNDENGIKEMINCISHGGGINNYCNEKKIYINMANEQPIYGKDSQIGSFINLSNLKLQNSNINKESKFQFMNSIPPKRSTLVKPQENISQLNISNKSNFENEKTNSKRTDGKEEDKKEKDNNEDNSAWDQIMGGDTFVTLVNKNISNANNSNNNLRTNINLKGPLDVVHEENFEDNDSQKSQITIKNNKIINNYIQANRNLNNHQRKNYIHNFEGGLYQHYSKNYNNFEDNIIISNLEDDNNQNNDKYNQNIFNPNMNNLNQPFIYNNISNANHGGNNLNFYNQINENINYQNSQNNQNINYGNTFSNYNQNNYYNNIGNNINNNYGNNMNMNENYQNYFNNQNMNNILCNNNLNMNDDGVSNFPNLCRNNKNNLYKSYFDEDNIDYFSNNNYINQNYNSIYKNHIKESARINDEITLTLVSKQLNKESKIKVKNNEKLNKIFELFKDDNWLIQYHISYIEINGRKLDFNKSLEDQGIFRDAQLNVFFSN
jgi:hypothetical protein